MKFVKTAREAAEANVKRMGRPPLPPDEKRLASMGFRPTPEIRARLEAAARTSNRSLSQEIESRLERSFLEESSAKEFFGGTQVFALARLIAAVVSVVEAGTGKTWRDDRDTHLQVRAAIDKILDSLGPGSVGEADERMILRKAQDVGKALVEVILGDVARSKEGTPAQAMVLLQIAAELGTGMVSLEELVRKYPHLVEVHFPEESAEAGQLS